MCREVVVAVGLVVRRRVKNSFINGLGDFGVFLINAAQPSALTVSDEKDDE